MYFFFFSSRRRHTRFDCDWSSDVCSSDLPSNSTAPAQTLFELEGSMTIARVRPPTFCGPRDTQEPVVIAALLRSEERRVGKECRSWWSPYYSKKRIRFSTTVPHCEQSTDY